MKKILLSLAVVVFSTMLLRSQTTYSYPLTEKEAVTDDYFGTKVSDPYRWLEDDRSARTAAWVQKQNKVTEDHLSGIPYRAKLRSRLRELWDYNKQSVPFEKGGHFFCYKNNGVQNQSVLYVKKSLEEEGKILLDPNTLSKDGTVSLSGLSVSKDGKTLAYGISTAGSDWVEIRFMSIENRQQLPDVIKWVKFSGISWRGNGIYYSRYDKPEGSALSQKNQFHKVYYHALGTAQESDALVFEDKNNPDYNFGVSLTEDEKYLFISTSKSTSGEKLAMKDLSSEGNPFITISDNFDNDYSVVDNVGETFYMLTNRKSPRYRLVSFTPATAAEKDWKTVIPEGKQLLEGVHLCNRKILAIFLQDVTSRLVCYNLEGVIEKEIALPGICRLSGINTGKDDKFATYGIVQFTAPEQTYYLDATTWESRLIFSPNCRFASQDYITEQVFYNSKGDGTRIPMFITHKKGLKMDANTPCFVYGYGGFNISIAPEFRIDRTVFLENGGIYCVPNIRGGGEYGEDWHKAGTKCKKQNVFDDFISACEWLVANNYTSYKKIAIHGRSNGGLLIGAVMTQRPDICKVALPTVGVLDMLRFHRFTIGRAWTVDYGSSENKEEFDCLIRYSPLHTIKDVNYPATLVLTGDHDDRVVPAHSFKFAATLQEKNKSKEPMLIRIDVNAGHGAGKPTSKQIDEFADMWSFVFSNLGMSL